ncbi:unnamed protein product, partial [Rotaria sp. Silwood1]
RGGPFSARFRRRTFSPSNG